MDKKKYLLDRYFQALSNKIKIMKKMIKKMKKFLMNKINKII